MSDPVTSVVRGCTPTPFSFTTCDEEVDYYSSASISGTCPSGTTGEPVTVPAGRFTSTISQADADAQAAAHLAELLSVWCVPIAPPIGKWASLTFLNDFASPAGLLSQVALDGGAWQNIVTGTAYKAYNKLKVRSVLSSPYTVNFGDGTITMGVHGTLSTSGPLNVIEPSYTEQQGAFSGLISGAPGLVLGQDIVPITQSPFSNPEQLFFPEYSLSTSPFSKTDSTNKSTIDYSSFTRDFYGALFMQILNAAYSVTITSWQFDWELDFN